MKKMLVRSKLAIGVILTAGALMLWSLSAQAAIQGVTGNTFHLVAKQDHISSGDGDSIVMWGYSERGKRMQYPGPTLIVNQGETITVKLTNKLPFGAGNVSIVFPGHQVTATGGVPGLLTREARADKDDVVTYQFTATHPGTYLYHSGTRPDLQVEMGLLGALIVRPKGFDPAKKSTWRAYEHRDTRYDREYLFLLTENDIRIHRLAEFGQYDKIDTSKFFQVNWFINGRNFPDVLAEPNVPWLPTQPYNSSPMMHPGEKVLCRIIGGGRDLHPFHLHGNEVKIIAKDGRVLESRPGAGPDLAYKDYTVTSAPGETLDVTFEWTGKGLGWDVYGHKPGDPLARNEYEPDHGKPYPVHLPNREDVIFGAFFSGSPFLGNTGALPPGHPGLNVGGGFFYMWHSHKEKELTSNDIFPGGMITFMNIVPWGVPIP